MSIFTLGDGSTNLVLHPKWDYKRKRKMDRVDHRMYDASLFSYRFASYDVFEMALEGINPGQAEILNGWWEAKTQLALGCLIGDNLLTNGFGERGNNYNLPAFTYESAGGYYDPGRFSYVCGPGYTLSSSEFIPINTSLPYHLQAAFKTNNVNTTLYAGFICYDYSGAVIQYFHAWRAVGRDTTLFSVASQGSLTVDIVPPVSSWYPPTNTCIQYDVSTTYSDLPNFKCSFISSIDNTLSSSYWRLTLWPTYPCPSTFPAGTRVGNTYSGATFNYSLMAAAVTSGQWVFKTTSVTGVNSYIDTPSYNRFRIGTAFIRLLVMPNYNQFDTTYFSGYVIKQAFKGLDISSVGVVIGGNRTPFPKFLYPRVDRYQGKLELEAVS